MYGAPGFGLSSRSEAEGSVSFPTDLVCALCATPFFRDKAAKEWGTGDTPLFCSKSLGLGNCLCDWSGCGCFGGLLSCRSLDLLRRCGSLCLLGRGDDGVERCAFHAGHKLHNSGVADVHDEAVDDLVAQVAMRHLASAEAQGGLHLVAVAEETDSHVFLRLVVMLVHSDREFDFLDDDDLLLLACSAVALIFFVEILAVVLDATDGGNGIGGDLDEVQPTFAGDLQSVERGHDAHLFAVFVDDANFSRADLFVGTDEAFDGSLVSKRWNNCLRRCGSLVKSCVTDWMLRAFHRVVCKAKYIICAKSKGFVAGHGRLRAPERA